MILSAEEFVRLRNSDLAEEYSRAALDEAPVSVWRDVISRFPEMREWVALNKSVPLEILSILAHDGSISVRSTVADKRKLSAELFDVLSRDREERVRLRVAHNKKTPPQVLERLLSDSSSLVRETAIRRLGGVS